MPLRTETPQNPLRAPARALTHAYADASNNLRECSLAPLPSASSALRPCRQDGRTPDCYHTWKPLRWQAERRETVLRCRR